MEEAEFLADHIAIIHKGKIIAEGSLDELIHTQIHNKAHNLNMVDYVYDEELY